MRVTAQIQDTILKLLLQSKRVMSLREITNHCDLTYHQVASGLVALRNKGYVQNVKAGVYMTTEEARLTEFSSEKQIEVLKLKVTELENVISSLLTRMSRMMINPYLFGEKKTNQDDSNSP